MIFDSIKFLLSSVNAISESMYICLLVMNSVCPPLPPPLPPPTPLVLFVYSIPQRSRFQKCTHFWTANLSLVSTMQSLKNKLLLESITDDQGTSSLTSSRWPNNDKILSNILSMADDDHILQTWIQVKTDALAALSAMMMSYMISLDVWL